jgi:DNA ligase-1
MKPLLACKADDLTKLEYPLLASPKIDGIRCLTFKKGAPKSRKLKDIPNKYICEVLTKIGIEGLDGELVIPGAKNFGEVSSAIMSREGKPNFEYHVFDVWNVEAPYTDRLEVLAALLYYQLTMPVSVIKFLSQKKMKNAAAVERYEKRCLEQGFEGVMLRSPGGKYKYGRSTLREQILLKVKRFEDSEAMLVGMIEELHNENEATKDNLGRTERSSHKENKKGKGTMGAMICLRSDGVEFKVGTGFTQEQRQEYWDNRDTLIPNITFVKYRFQPSGAKEAPRFPSFLGLRHQDDM